MTIHEISARSRSYTTDRLYYTSDGEWIVRAQLPAADRSNGPAGGSPSLVEGGHFDVTMRNAAGATIGTKRFEGYPKHFNLRGSFDRQNRPFHTTSVTVEQRVGPVGLEVAYKHGYVMRDQKDLAATGSGPTRLSQSRRFRKQQSAQNELHHSLERRKRLSL